MHVGDKTIPEDVGLPIRPFAQPLHGVQELIVYLFVQRVDRALHPRFASLVVLFLQLAHGVVTYIHPEVPCIGHRRQSIVRAKLTRYLLLGGILVAIEEVAQLERHRTDLRVVLQNEGLHRMVKLFLQFLHVIGVLEQRSRGQQARAAVRPRQGHAIVVGTDLPRNALNLSQRVHPSHEALVIRTGTGLGLFRHVHFFGHLFVELAAHPDRDMDFAQYCTGIDVASHDGLLLIGG
ncbi:hypothetical protein D3C87_1133450 [compost metagenome]